VRINTKSKAVLFQQKSVHCCQHSSTVGTCERQRLMKHTRTHATNIERNMNLYLDLQ